MLNSLTTSAHNSLPSNQVSHLLAGALLLAAAALTGCNADQRDLHADLSGCLGQSHTWLDAADSTKSAFSLAPSRHHAHIHDLSRTELTPHRLKSHTL